MNHNGNFDGIPRNRAKALSNPEQKVCDSFFCTTQRAPSHLTPTHYNISVDNRQQCRAATKVE